jgi:hypothetical protein
MVAKSPVSEGSDGVAEMKVWEELVVAVEAAARNVLEKASYASAVVFSTPFSSGYYCSHAVVSGPWDEDVLAWYAKELFEQNFGELAQFKTSAGTVIKVRVDLYTDPVLEVGEKSSILGQIVNAL